MNNESLMLNINQLAEEIHLSAKTIRTALSRKPGSLPPRLIIPGQKKLLWLREDVVSFYRAQIRSQGVNPAFQPAKKEPLIPIRKRRGAPTMAERVVKASKFKESDGGGGR